MRNARAKRPACRQAGKLFVISAPSGCGKTTLAKKLLNDNLGVIHSISMTTRSPRPEEKGGVDYRFISRELFEDMIARGEFLEYEENFGYIYGTPKKFIEDNLKKGKAILLTIDVKGAMRVKAAYPKYSILIFILPPSLEALKKRLKYRMTDSEHTITKRLKLAKKEMLYKKRYNYVIVNDRLDHAYSKLKNIIVKEISNLKKR